MFVNLQLHLRPGYPPCPPHPTPHTTPFPQPRSYPSPSGLRRSKRRAHARERQVVKTHESEKVSLYSEVLNSENQNIKLPAEQAGTDTAGNIAAVLPTKADTMAPENVVAQKLWTKDVPKDEENTDQSQDEAIPENEVGEVYSRVNEDEYDATSSTTTTESDQSQQCCYHACCPGRGRPPDKCCYHRCRKPLGH